MKFEPFPKMPRLARECVVTEKIDGTNASVYIDGTCPGSDLSGAVATTLHPELGTMALWAGSRTRWITPEDDNFGFAAWVRDNAAELVKLGPGHHFGEWWGKGIQRGYGLDHRRWSLFNVTRWATERPACCHVVPVIYCGGFETQQVDHCLEALKLNGSAAAPGFMEPEGVVVCHTAANQPFKKTLFDDDGKERKLRKERPALERKPRDPNTGGRRKGCDGYNGPKRRKSDQ